MIQMSNTKICTKCNKELPATNEYFFKHKLGKYGLESQCKKCVKMRRMKRYKNTIYEIYCIETNMYYIGQTIKPITERISKHFSDAKRGRKQPLYEDIRKYGKDKFKYKVLTEVNNENELDDMERYYISLYLEEGKSLYNRELGGKKNAKVCEETKILQAKQRGTKDFMVFDCEGLCLGEYYSFSQATDELGYFDFKKYLNNVQLNNKGFIVISEDKFTYNLLYNSVKAYRYLEDTFDYNVKEELPIKKEKDISGENNPMYGKKGCDNPNSKRVYIVKDDKIINVFDSANEVQEKYDFQARAYARGTSGHYYKKLNLYVYYDNFLPEHIRISMDSIRSDKSIIEDTNVD